MRSKETKINYCGIEGMKSEYEARLGLNGVVSIIVIEAPVA